MERRNQQLQRQNNALQSQVQEKEQRLQKLRTGKRRGPRDFSLLLMNALFVLVSEAVCKEYEQLKHQYDVETGAMHKAMQQASQVDPKRLVLLL